MEIRMKKLTKIMCMVLCFSLLLSLTAYASDSKVSEIRGDVAEKLQDVILEVNDEYSVVVSIPVDKVDEYYAKIESDIQFRRKEIASALAFAKIESRKGILGVGFQALPEGHIEYQKYMYRKDIKRAVDSYSGAGTFAAIVQAANVINKTVVAQLVHAAGKKNAYFLAADLLAISVVYARDQRLAWWKEALRDIIAKKIKAVRYTIVQNPGEYPKVWRVFERIA